MIKVGELKGRTVIGIESARKIGTLKGLVIDLDANSAVGLRISGPEMTDDYFLPARSVQNIGPDAITVSEAGLSQTENFAGLPDTHALGGTKVVTVGGTMLGTISDVFLDEGTLQLQGFQLDGAGLEQLFGRGKFLRAAPGYRYGGDIMLVPDGVVSDQTPATNEKAARPAPVASNAPVAPVSPSAPTLVYSPESVNRRATSGSETRVIDLDEQRHYEAAQAQQNPTVSPDPPLETETTAQP